MDFAIALQTDEDFEQGQQELAKLIGAADAAKISWMSRLVRRPDGFKIRVMEPEVDLRSQLIVSAYGPHKFANPWLADPHLLGIRVREWALEEGVALLRGSDNPETEIFRRRDLIRQNEERIQREKDAAIARGKAEQEARARQLERDRQLKRAEWDELSESAKFSYLLALVFEDGVDLPGAMRSLAAKGSRFPDRPWWGSGQ